MLVVTLGARTVEGAIRPGSRSSSCPSILKALGVSPAYQFILFGLGAITYAKHPEGIVECKKRKSLEARPALARRASGRRPAATEAAVRRRPDRRRRHDRRGSAIREREP